MERETKLAEINALRNLSPSTVIVESSQLDDSSLTTPDVSDSGSDATASQDQDEEIKTNLPTGYNADKDQNVDGQTTPDQDDVVSLSNRLGSDANSQKRYDIRCIYCFILQFYTFNKIEIQGVQMNPLNPL